MKRMLIAVVVLVVALGGVATTAQAHSSAFSAAKARYYHARGIVKWIGHHAKVTQYHPNPRKKRHWKTAVKFWAGVREEAWSFMHPKPQPTFSFHWAGWSCITNGAYAGAPHEGNGYNGSYTGPLGMTTPWAGHYPTGSDWVHTPISVVYGFAEQEAARNNFNYSWMQGQWPRTFPPCAGFFR